jgi:hypothetical protein
MTSEVHCRYITFPSQRHTVVILHYITSHFLLRGLRVARCRGFRCGDTVSPARLFPCTHPSHPLSCHAKCAVSMGAKRLKRGRAWRRLATRRCTHLGRALARARARARARDAAAAPPPALAFLRLAWSGARRTVRLVRERLVLLVTAFREVQTTEWRRPLAAARAVRLVAG